MARKTVRRNARLPWMPTTGRWLRIGSLTLTLLGSGCTSLQEFVNNGFKVGPNYQRPPAPLADGWIDAGNPRVKMLRPMIPPGGASSAIPFWTTWSGPPMHRTSTFSRGRNPCPRSPVRSGRSRLAGTRPRTAECHRLLHPHAGERQPRQLASEPLLRHLGHRPQRLLGDRFLGQDPPSIESADDAVAASVDDYDNVMVSLIGDVATAYVQYRIFEQQLVYTRQNLELQRGSLKIASDRFKAGQTNELSVLQSTSLLEARSHHPTTGDCTPPGEQPTLRPAALPTELLPGSASARPRIAGGSRRGYSGRPHPPATGPADDRALDRGPECPNWRRRRRLLPCVFPQRQPRLSGQGSRQPVGLEELHRSARAGLPVGHLELRTHPE